MKKFYVVLAAALCNLAAFAEYTLNNPVGEDGRYIVKYDCEQGKFAASNDMEADETFTFAIDITGTWLAEWVKAPATAEGASRSIATNAWTSKGDVIRASDRLKQIDGNIYGKTIKISQTMTNEELKGQALMQDSVLYVYASLFGFEYTADNPGAMWWQWDGNPEGETRAPGADCLFAFAPYTGTKTNADFFSDDFEEGMFGMSEAGYAAPCVLATAIEETVADTKVSNKFIQNGQLYILHNGKTYNALGVEVK